MAVTIKRILLAVLAGLASAAISLTAFAEDAAPAAPAADAPASSPAAKPEPAPADTKQEVKQIALTDGHVQNFVKAQADLASIATKIQAAGEKQDPALQAELENIAKKHGFASFAELDDVAANISIVMAGLDSQTGSFVDPVEALQKELEDVKKDESIPEADKKQLVEELNEAIKTTPPLQNKGNIEIVKAHRAEIEKALQ